MKLSSVPTVVAVASGKGGVGKTTVATDVAKVLRDGGNTVGMVDADVSTPNSFEVLGGEDVDVSDQRLSTHDSLIPPVVMGIQLASQGIVLPDDVPVLRDGEWRASAVADYIENVEWSDDTDVVVVDTPPGTGEEIQTIAAAAPPDYGVIVTTPHPSSVRDARKTHEFFEQAEVEHSTIINMAYIPAADVVHHVIGDADFTEIDKVGDSINESVVSMIEKSASDFDLFGYEGGSTVPWGDTLSTVPYTTEYNQRSDAYLDVVDRVMSISDGAQEAETVVPENGGGD